MNDVKDAAPADFDLLYQHESGGRQDEPFYLVNREAIERARAARDERARQSMKAALSTSDEDAYAYYRRLRTEGNHHKTALLLQGHHGDAIRLMEGASVAAAAQVTSHAQAAALTAGLTPNELLSINQYVALKNAGKSIAAAAVARLNWQALEKAGVILAATKGKR